MAFMAAADTLPREYRTLCYLLCMTGCRISEALALLSDRVDAKAKVIVFESLKKRKLGVYRAVPVPPALIDMLELVHDLKRTRPRKPAPLWSIGRTRAWQIVKATMKAAKVKGTHATPKGLRHGFGVRPCGAIGGAAESLAALARPCAANDYGDLRERHRCGGMEYCRADVERRDVTKKDLKSAID